MTNLIEKYQKKISNNPKLRFLVAGLAFIFVIVFVAYVFHKHMATSNAANHVGVSAVPDSIKSIPAAGDPSNNYVHSQALANKDNAQQALKTGGSAVPTITRSDFMGSLQAFQEGGSTTCQEPGIPKNPSACTIPNLKLARSAGVEAIELRCKGCACPDIKSAGYTAGQLKKAGYTAKSLRECGYSLQDLVAAGFSAADLRAAGFTADQLAKAGFTADQLRAAGYSPDELAKIGMLHAFDKKGTCSIANLKKLRAQGVSAAKLKQCGAAALKAAGYSAKDLVAAGFSPKDLLASGFSPKELHDAGVSAADLVAAGVKPGQLLAAGYTPKDLLNAGVSVAQLRKAGVSAAALKKAGVSAAALKAAGYTDGDLVRAGFSNSKIHPDSAIQCSVTALRKAREEGVSASKLKKCGAAALLAAGYTPAQLAAAGFAAAQLAAAGVTPAQLAAAGFTPYQLAAAGITQCDPATLRRKHAEGVPAAQLAKCGAAALLAAGYTPAQLEAAGVTAAQLAAAGIAGPGSKAAMINSLGNSAGLNGNSTIAPIDSDPFEKKIERLRRMQQTQMNQAQKLQTLNLMKAQMSNLSTQLLNGWGQTSSQAIRVALKPKKPGENGTGNGSNAGVSGPIIKAGSIMYAVLITGLNSDEKSPIMAKIVAGKLKGSKLIGQFVRENDRVIISFNLINIPGKSTSLPLNAVAIDSNTARTALASHVNHHYLLRYGSLFASSFLAGLGQASQASRGFVIPGIISWHSNDPMNTSQKIAVAAGYTAQQYASVMKDNFSKPPTVKVAAGAGMGILFMQDFALGGAPSTGQ